MWSAPPRTFITSAAVLFLCRSLVTFWIKWWYRSKHPSFSEKANTWIGGRNNFRNFLRKHSSEIFTENKKFEKGTTFNIKSVFPPRLLHLYHRGFKLISIATFRRWSAGVSSLETVLEWGFKHNQNLEVFFLFAEVYFNVPLLLLVSLWAGGSKAPYEWLIYTSN